MPIKKNVILAVISGLLLTAAFSGGLSSVLGWVALVPLLVALRPLSPGAAFKTGMITGMIHYLSLLYWVVYTMRVYGYLPWWLSCFFLVLLAAYLALYPGLFAFFLVRYCKKPLGLLILAPLCAVALEYVRGFLLSGFPWMLLGYSQLDQLALIQMADIAGVYGISFLMVMVNAAVYLLLLTVAENPWHETRMTRGQMTGAGVLTLCLVLTAFFYGRFRIADISAAMAGAPAIRVALIQGNIDQTLKWDQALQIQTTRKYVDMTRGVKSPRPDLVVWPETAMPFPLEAGGGLTSMLTDMTRQTGMHLVTGHPSVEAVSPDRVVHYNSASLVMPDGHVVGRYDKVHLVPFGEYVPLKQVLFFVDKMVAGVGDFLPGRKGHTLKWKPDKPDLGVQICFEIIFPDLSRALVQNGAGLLVNLTNDAWFGTTPAARQHFTMAAFRAVENRRALVRCANTGITGIVDPAGRVIRKTGLFEDAVVVETVPLMHEISFYTRFGDMLPRTCLGVMMLLMFFSWRNRRKPTSPEKRPKRNGNRIKH